MVSKSMLCVDGQGTTLTAHERMMDSYGITEEVAKESVIHICHYRRIRG